MNPPTLIAPISELIKTEPNRPPHLSEDHAAAVSSPQQSPSLGYFAVSVGEVHTDSTVSVVSFDITGTLKQKVVVALSASAAPPPKRQLDE